MKHLKMFKESVQTNLDIIKDYFLNIKDELDDFCDVEFTETNSNYFKVQIRKKVEIRKKNSIDKNIFFIDSWIKSNELSVKILNELKTSLSRLEDESIIDTINIEKISNGYVISIHTNIIDNNEIEDWVIIDDNEIKHDPKRLKLFMMERFKLQVVESIISEDYNDNEKYTEMTIKVRPQETVTKDLIESIKKYFLEKEAYFEDQDDNSTFVESVDFSQREIERIGKNQFEIFIYFDPSVIFGEAL